MTTLGRQSAGARTYNRDYQRKLPQLLIPPCDHWVDDRSFQYSRNPSQGLGNFLCIYYSGQLSRSCGELLSK